MTATRRIWVEDHKPSYERSRGLKLGRHTGYEGSTFSLRHSGSRLVGRSSCTLGTPVVARAAPCRIVRAIDEPTRWGFAYGTLPGHPEQGEEAFVVSMSDESVRLDIDLLPRPGDSVVRLSGPIGRGVQRAGTKAYLRALRQFVELNR